MRTLGIVFVLLLTLLSTAALADVPGLMNYQGTLTDGDGVALDTTVAMTFSIYTDSVGGSQIWTETQLAVAVGSGIFNVILGSVNAISEDVFSDPVRWLGVQVGADPELTPRQRITTAGYAFRTAEADTADYARSASAVSDGDWTVTGDDLYSAVSGDVGIGTSSPAAKLDLRGRLNVGQDGTGYDVNIYGDANGGRLFWEDGHMALRVGRDSDGTHWLGIGEYSVAMGYNTEASGDYSLVHGDRSTASGKKSIAMGYYATASGDRSVAIGEYVSADTTNAITLGKGQDFSNRLINGTPNSLMVGFGSTQPILFVGGPDSRMGVGTSSPSEKLHVDGNIRAENAYLIGASQVLSVAGTENTLVGIDAGASNTGGYGTFVGHYAGQVNQGNFNTFLGLSAGTSNSTGSKNTFLGQGAGYNNLTGFENTFLGQVTGLSNTSGSCNTFLGKSAGYYNATGDSNVFIGYRAGYTETGSNKLYIANGSDTSDVLMYGDFSMGRVGIGTLSPAEHLHVEGNARVGDTLFVDGRMGIGTASPATKLDVSGDINTDSLYKIGGNTVLSASSTMNTMVGVGAGENNTENYATFVGDSTGHNNQGECNTFLGAWAGRSNTTGRYNTFLGYAAGHSNTLSNFNTFLGYFAGRYNTTGIRNTFLGARAGWTNTADSGNVFIGFEAGQNVTGSNKLCIANSAGNCIIYGDFSTGNVGIGTTNPGSKVHVAGNVEALGFTIFGVPVGTSSDSYWSAGGGDIYYNSGNVGIGTASPARKLHVDDVLRLEPRSTYPSSPGDGDICVVGSAGSRHIYCYLNGAWSQLD